jgi:hypothetical protein
MDERDEIRSLRQRIDALERRLVAGPDPASRAARELAAAEQQARAERAMAEEFEAQERGRQQRMNEQYGGGNR